MSKKQITLFQTWNKNSSIHGSPNATAGNAFNAEQQLPVLNASSSNIYSSNPFQSPKFQKKDESGDPEFDYEAGKTWIYPTNYPIRDYQFSIVQEALFKNTLVVLPTGLGKTFIAAVVMYNIYRWYPTGKVVFMAPTKPLVAQQVDACFNITGIPQEDTTQMTGTNAPELRKRMWLRKRVFFLTPQVLVNDLVRNICPASSIKCLVVDEAHKALGNHAYCQVIKELCAYTSQFRVLALSATPGSETQAVKQVLANLLISHVEMRSEDSDDVQQYTHIRDIEKIVVPLGDRLTSLKSKFLDVINVYLKRLTLRNVITSKNPSSLSKFQVLKLREAFSQNPPSNIDRATYGLAMADFSLLISLYHAYELLLLHGACSFYNFLIGILNGDKSIPHARTELLKNFEFQEIIEKVKDNYIPDPTVQSTVLNGQNRQKKVLPGHPKLDKLLEVVLEHFRIAEFENITETRVMIFTQYRDSVQEIVDMLHQHHPKIKVMSFIGQSSKSASNVGYSQKRQLEVIQKFRSGGYNTLVSTCVGEEGLDIGEVDLIVCYDCPKSPIRLVQRMGRTGRLRKGRIIILIAEGKEEQMYNTCEYRKKSVHRAITRGFSFAQLHQNSPSLLPAGVKPVCVKTQINIQRKKLEPKLKVTSKIPFLTDEEMAEFDQHIRVPQKDGPLLPKREFIVLKNPEVWLEESTSAPPTKPQISLSEWTLWQTTPQRTDMIPHSSKSLLLVKTLENIHFPEILTSKKSLKPDFTDFKNNSLNRSLNNHFNSFSKQTKITDLISTSKNTEDVTEICESPEMTVFETDIPVKLDNLSNKLPLIERLFDINLSFDYKNQFAFDLKPPPMTVKIFSEDFSNIDLNKIIDRERKNVSIIRVLNKKMKAKLKRKSKELGRGVFYKDIKSATPIKGASSLLKDINMSETSVSSFDVCAKSGPEEPKNSPNDPEAVMFDVNFDILGAFENDMQLCPDKVSELNSSPDSHYQNERSLQNNEEELSSINFDLDFCENEGLLNSNHAEKNNPIIISSTTNDGKEHSRGLKISQEVSNGKNHVMDSVSNALPDISNKKKQALHDDEMMFDSIHFDLEFNNVEKELYPKHSEEVNISSPRLNEEKNINLEALKRMNEGKNHHSIGALKSDKDLTSVTGNKKEEVSNISASLTEEKQPSVLKDMKNTSHVLIKEKNTEIRTKLHTKFNHLVSTSKTQSERLENCSSVSLYSKRKDATFNSLQNLENKSKLHNINDYRDFGGYRGFTKVDVSKNIVPVKDGNDVNNDNISSRNCRKGEFLLKDKSNIQNLNETDKNVSSKGTDGGSTRAKPTNVVLQPDSDEKTTKINHSFIEEWEEDSIVCNFDISFSNNDVDAGLNSSESTKMDSVSDYPDPLNHLDEFNKDASSILDQLSTSQKSVAADLNSSFSSPLTVKRCISEAGEDAVSKRRKKLQKVSDNLCDFRNSSHGKSKTEKLNDSGIFKIPLTNQLNTSKINSKSNQSIHLAEDATQCTLTQLLSLIDGTQHNERNSLRKSPNKSLNKEESEADEASSLSDDEVCPTPPKVDKVKSEFIYNKKYGVNKSLDFKNFSKSAMEISTFQKGTENAQKSFQPHAFEIKSHNHSVDENKPQVNVKKDINVDSFTSKVEQKDTNFQSIRDSPVLENEIVEQELSQKITFDVSFDFPFTENDLENSKDDLNNALILENSSSEEKIISCQTNDSTCCLKSESGEKGNDLFDMKLCGESSTHQKNLHIEEICLVDELETENSESLLSSKSLGYGKFSGNMVENAVARCTIVNEPEKHSKSSPENKNKQNIKTSVCEDELKQEDFEKSFFFDPLSPNDCASTNTCLSKSEKREFHFKHINNDAVPSTTIQSKHILKKDNLNSLSDINEDNSCTRAKLLGIDKVQNSDMHSKYSSRKNNFKNLQKLSETEHISDETNAQNHELEPIAECIKSSEEFSEEKLCFDLSFVNDEDCDFLPPAINPISSVKQSNFPNRDCTQNVKENSAVFEKNSPTNHLIETKEKEDSKNISKRPIFETHSDKNVGKVNEVNDELMWEFDLDDEDQNFLLEFETNNPTVTGNNLSATNKQFVTDNNPSETQKQSVAYNNPSVKHNDNEQTIVNIGYNSSDEFDLCNPNQNTKPKKSTELSSKFATRNQPTGFDAGCSNWKSREDICSKGINKPSSKLSIKNKGSNTSVLKNNAGIEDEDDFQFIRKVPKKLDKSPSFPNKKRKKLNNRNKFLLSQAEVSRFDNSSQESDDDDDDVDDLLEESFIDDESTEQLSATEQHAFYLKSIKNCAGLPQKFKLKATENDRYLPQINECSDYEFDSFCVNDEDVVYISSEDDLEHNSELRYKDKTKKCRRTKPTKRFARAVINDSTSSSEHETSPRGRKCFKKSLSASNIPGDELDDSVIVPRKPKHKLVILSSDEEDEHTFIKPVNPEPHKKPKKGKNEKPLQPVLIQDSSTSSEHEISPKVKEHNKKYPCTSNIPDNKHDDSAIGGKHELGIANAEKKNKNVFNHINSEVHTKTGDACTATKPASDCTNTERLVFSIDFDVNDADFFLPENDKGENTTSVDSNNPKPVNQNKAQVSTLNNLPSTSGLSHCDLNLEKCNQASEACDQIADVSFDIQWDEVFPPVSSNNEASPVLPNEDTLASKPVNSERNNEDSIILVDSRELASGKPVISALRNKHRINPVVMTLSSADYIISNRIAIERVLDSEFNGNPMPPKFIEKIKELIDIYEKPVVIIEKDNRKNRLSFNKNTTKYLQFVVQLNCLPCIKILFSKSTDHTSELIVNLIQQERKRGFHINVPVAVNEKNKNLFDFYSSFPKVSPLCALNFMYHFPTVESLLKSSVENLKQKGCISSHRANSIYKYFKSELTFHENM